MVAVEAVASPQAQGDFRSQFGCSIRNESQQESLHRPTDAGTLLREVAERTIEGTRDELPTGAAAFVDLAARWMRENRIVGPLAGGSIEFLFDDQERVRGWYAKTRGGRHDLEPAPEPTA